MHTIRTFPWSYLALPLALFFLEECKDGTTTTSAVVDTTKLTEKVASEVRGPHVVLDEEFVVPSGGWQSREFRLPGVRPVRLNVQGVKDTAKGFTVYVMRTSEEDNFKANAAFRHLPSFQGLKVTSFTHTEDLPPGDWAVIVQNTENLLRSMTVRVQLTTDPK